MQAIQSANVLTIATGFATEALRVGAIFNGQLTFFENHVAIDIGDGDFCCRDEVKIVEGAVITFDLPCRAADRCRIPMLR